MRMNELLDAIERLARVHATLLEVRPGQQANSHYEANEVLRATNALAKRLADLPPSVDTDDIPF